MAKHTILFLAANPLCTDRLALDQEARAIQVELERSGRGEKFELVTRWAVRPLDLLRELRRHRPTIVHFSGHGGSGEPREFGTIDTPRPNVTDADAINGDQQGLFFQGPDDLPQLVSTAALGETFGAVGASVKLVVLNACYSEAQAEALRAYVDCVVGVGESISDDAARNFAIGFYGGLGERESVANAYRQGLAAISLSGRVNGERPQLKVRSGIDANRLVLTLDSQASVAEVNDSTASRSSACAEIGKLAAHDDKLPTAVPSGLPSAPDEYAAQKGCSAAPSPTKARYAIVIRANVKDFDAQRIARALEELHQLTGDITLQITDVEEGSVRLTVTLSRSAAKKLEELRVSGQWAQLCGFEIVEFIELSLSGTAGTTAVTPSAPRRNSTQVHEQRYSERGGLAESGRVAVALDWVPAYDSLPALTQRDVRAAVAELFKQHGEAVFGYCVRMMRDAIIAEDLMQQVYLEAYRDFDRIRGEASRRTWLFGIATRRCVDALRQRRREAAMSRSELVEEAHVVAAATDQEAFVRDDRTQLLAALDECLCAMSPDVRATILLRFSTDLTYEQMAEHLHASPDALQIRVSRAMSALRRCLERKGWSGE